ncbi:hypothetical protein [Mycobacterium sp. NPDC050441]|uniref:hypothetical protein n=1 Tax=Mycobacterium sp. NPDC050441 TaxID=3155403 RepID=UPI0033F36079
MAHVLPLHTLVDVRLQKGMLEMIVLTDTVKTWGHSATIHYSHAPRAVVAQSTLALHMEFNVDLPPKPIFRSFGFFRTAVVDGSTITLNGPSLVATGVTELHFELLTDNGASVSVVNQFDTTGTFSGPPQEPISVRRVSFHRSNGTTAYAHTTKVYAGGRDISEHEAVETATATMKSLGLDPAELIMKVTTDAEHVSRLQRLDPSTNELVDEATDPLIG